VGLGDLFRGGSQAEGVNADGTVVVGFDAVGGLLGVNVAFHWTQAGGMAAIGPPPGPDSGESSEAEGVNADGTVVVGGSDTGAFRWTQAGGMVGLGFLPGGTSSNARGVNADGTVVVGGSSATGTGPNAEAFRWTQAGGMVGLGFLPGGTSSDAVAVNRRRHGRGRRWQCLRHQAPVERRSAGPRLAACNRFRLC
jgi:probable HAF family extracellular repeat protein